MSKLWEVDPETRSKLQEIQKQNENSRCVDCGAPSPQWVSLTLRDVPPSQPCPRAGRKLHLDAPTLFF